jgi:hypothetical protein
MAKKQTNGADEAGAPAPAPTTPPECFVVMPITDPDGYELNHFRRVFEDIFTPACAMAGYRAVRADQVRETNLIHLDVLQRLLESPMVLCDLSSRNPNVLFELGLRQAFDRPVVLTQETGTPKIFDIAPLRYVEYRRARTYHEVLEDQQELARCIEATRDAYERGVGINSMVKLLSLARPATLVDVHGVGNDPAIQLLRAELAQVREDVALALQDFAKRLQPARRWPLWNESDVFVETASGAQVNLSHLVSLQHQIQQGDEATRKRALADLYIAVREVERLGDPSDVALRTALSTARVLLRNYKRHGIHETDTPSATE